ncbi:MAG: N-acetylmuramoyl-L-alanine amidase [Gammaproteobacteria bacterium]|nr:N-acetylmuramoyl-L-alanine amidase [Gammaproteobacteria bacterium]
MNLRTQLKKYPLLVIVILSTLALPIFALSSKITGLQITTVHDHPHITFQLTAPFTYHVFTLSSPSRLVVDFDQVRTTTHLERNFSKYNLIENIRSALHHQHGLRVVFDLKRDFNPKYFTLKPQGKYKYRLVIDLLSPAQKATTPKKIPEKTTTLTPVKFKPKPLRNVVVVIDPGHGGKDPGATGSLGTHEKAVVLAIGKDLYNLLKKQYGIDPRLTRSGDYFVPLRGRLQLARKGIADMFVAIHADAYRDRFAEGSSVFALSERGATSEAARWLAQKENYSELMGGVDLSDKSYMLRSVLIDLYQTATIRDSLQLGHYVLMALGHITQLHHNFVEQAPFVVLKSPDIPSILVETGFISNQSEERKLRSAWYQQKIAHALMIGIVDYLNHYPPPNTFLAKQKER